MVGSSWHLQSTALSVHKRSLLYDPLHHHVCFLFFIMQIYVQIEIYVRVSGGSTIRRIIEKCLTVCFTSVGCCQNEKDLCDIEPRGESPPLYGVQLRHSIMTSWIKLITGLFSITINQVLYWIRIVTCRLNLSYLYKDKYVNENIYLPGNGTTLIGLRTKDYV